jgi:hypothetical protein
MKAEAQFPTPANATLIFGIFATLFGLFLSALSL